MSDSNRALLSYVEETIFGTTPSGPPTLKDLRFTSESLHGEMSTVTSQEIRADRQVSDFIRNGLSAAGGINWELSYGVFDDFFQALLQSTNWTSPNTVTLTTISAAAADNSFNRSAGDWSAQFSAGQWLRASGFANAANNGVFKIVSVTATKIVVTGGTLVNESAGPSFTLLSASQITNGTTLKFFTIERQYTDLTNIFEVFRGMCFDQGSMAISADQIVTGGFTLIGKNALSGTATVGTGTNTAAPTNPVQNGIDNIVKVLEGGGLFDIVSGSWQLQNNLRARLQVGSLGAISIGSGTVNVTGQITAYFATNAILDKFLNFTASSLAFVHRDALGNIYVVEFPRVKYSSGQRVAGGLNQDIIADLNFTAFRHETEGVTARITRFAA